MSHSQGREPSWEKSYVAYLGKETRSNIHEWLMALTINKGIAPLLWTCLCSAQGFNSTGREQDKLSPKPTSTTHNSPR